MRSYILENMVKVVLRFLRTKVGYKSRYMTVLNVGCGPGWLEGSLAFLDNDFMQNTQFFSLDIAPGMAKTVKKQSPWVEAAGKPIVCCSKGEPARYVSETNSGIIVKPGDYEVLAQSILYLINNRVIASKLGESGRWFVEKNLSVKKVGLEMRRVFETLLFERRRGRRMASMSSQCEL